MFKDNKGNQLTYKEYMDRWKKGIEQVTPLQQAQAQFKSTIIMLIGILTGIIITIADIKKLWWVMLILSGAFGVTAIQLLGLFQKKRALQKFDELAKGVKEI